MKTNVYFWFYLTKIFLEREMFHTEIVKEIKTHILCSVTFFLNHAIYDIMWENIVDAGRPQLTVWHTRIAFWIPKTTNTHSQYAIFTDFLLQQWLHERASTLRYTYIASIVPLKISNLFDF